MHRLEREQTSILDKKQAKLDTLRRENVDAYQGVMWLRENRNIFKAPVHDPIMLTLDVKDKSYARYVETHIGRADLEGFVCEDPDDVNLLTKNLREKLHLRKINAFHSNPEPAGRFQHPVPSQEMAKYTFQDYLSNMYSAPEAVNAYLCKQKHLHQVPVFREENRFTGELKNRFQNFYIKDQKFNTRKSRYPPFEVRGVMLEQALTTCYCLSAAVGLYLMLCSGEHRHGGYRRKKGDQIGCRGEPGGGREDLLRVG